MNTEFILTIIESQLNLHQ